MKESSRFGQENRSPVRGLERRRKPVTRQLFILGVFSSVSLAWTSAHATPLLTTNFASLGAVTVDAADLTGVTTGGTWTLNTTRGATYATQVNGAAPGPVGSTAVVLDDTNGGNAGVISFATLTLDSAVDFSTDAVTWSFPTATRRTGANKGLRYEFLTGVTSVATLNWDEGGGLTLTGSNSDTGSSAFQFLNDWINSNDPRGVREMAFTFFDDTLDVTITDPGLVGNLQGPNNPLQSASLSVSLGSSIIDRLVVYSTGSENAGAKGVFLGEITVIQVPEPGVTMLAVAAGGLLAIRVARRLPRSCRRSSRVHPCRAFGGNRHHRPGGVQLRIQPPCLSIRGLGAHVGR